MQPSSVGIRSNNQIQMERQRFDTEKDRLAGEIHKVVLNWVQASSTEVPYQLETLAEGTSLYLKEDLTNGKLGYYVIDENKLLTKVIPNVDVTVNKCRANTTAFAAYNFFLARLVTDYTTKYENMGSLIKETEQIDDLKNSNLFKSASLAIVQISISKIEANKYMLQSDKSQWWV